MSIPTAIRTQGFYFDITAAPTPYNSKNKLLLIGHMIENALSIAAIDQPILCTKSNVETLFGTKSMLTRMYKMALKNAPFQEIWALPVAAVGAAMTGTITVDNASTNIGQAIFYIAGQRLSVTIQDGETNDNVAANIVAAINNHIVGVTAVAADEVVTLTCVHKGALNITLTNDDVGDEGTIGKNTLTFSGIKLTGGNGVPDETTALLSLGEDEYDYIATPFSSTSNLDRLRDLMVERWGFAQNIFGHVVTALNGSLGELATAGVLRNDPHVTNMGTSDSTSPLWDWCAALGAVMASHLGDAPEMSRPLHTLVLKGIRLPKTIFDQSERNVLLFDGIATFNKTPGNEVAIDRAITMYRLTALGIEDASWLDSNTLAQNVYAIRYLKTELAGKFGRVAIADSNPNNVTGVVTIGDIRTELVQAYMGLVKLGICENIDGFESLLNVVRPDNDATRVNIELGNDFVNQLEVFAINAKSYLQIEDGA